MAKIISCAWTTPAVRARVKKCTRREWPESYARQFKAGDTIQLYDKTPRCGGKFICMVRLTAAPVLESSGLAPASDWFDEGFSFLTAAGATVNKMRPVDLWVSWFHEPRPLWVIRWEYLEEGDA